MERTAETKLEHAGDRSAVSDLRRFTRLEAVARQIEMAVRARLQFNDPVSALSLLGAAERVLDDLRRASEWGESALSIRLFVRKFIKPEKQKKIAEMLRKPYNRLKHADTDRKVDPTIDLHMLDTQLMMVIKEFKNQSQSLTPVMQAYRCWAATCSDGWGAEEILGEEKLKALRMEARGKSHSSIFDKYLSHFKSKSLVPNP